MLTCIANLSNDEVFMPPELANRMPDALAEAWAANHGGAKTALVLAAIQRLPGEFSVADLQKKCPGVSLDMIRHLLKKLRGKQVECLGRGHQARWQKKSNG